MIDCASIILPITPPDEFAAPIRIGERPSGESAGIGSILAGTIIGIGLLITGAQMVFESQRKICRNSWPLIFNILYVVQYLLMNHKENKHEPSKQPSENYHGDNCRLQTEMIYCK